MLREGIHEYAAHADRSSEAGQNGLLALFDELVPRIPERNADEVEDELAAVRNARRSGGRRPSQRTGYSLSSSTPMRG